MKPSEKAKEIYDQMKGFRVKNSHRKKCALVCVDGIIEAIEAFGYTGTFFDSYETGKMVCGDDVDPCEYWREVKSEIEKL